MALQESLRSLTPDQKLAIVTQLWDDLAATVFLTLPPDELAEMRIRRDELTSDPSIAIDEDEVWRRVDGNCVGQSFLNKDRNGAASLKNPNNNTAPAVQWRSSHI